MGKGSSVPEENVSETTADSQVGGPEPRRDLDEAEVAEAERKFIEAREAFLRDQGAKPGRD
jgi:hypothetical protein